MQCSEFEIRLCDYQDGTLDEAARREVEQHASECRLCAALLADARALTGFLERVEPVEAPGELITNILYRTQHARWSSWSAGRWWRAWFQPLLQPRVVMSMAMTILSVSMLYRVAGAPIRDLKAADLNPVSLWRRVDNGTHRVWDRGVKFYQNARFVYEIVWKLRALEAEEEQAREAERRSTDKSKNPPPEAKPRKLEPLPAPARGKSG